LVAFIGQVGPRARVLAMFGKTPRSFGPGSTHAAA
jgi:hypothetical protein